MPELPEVETIKQQLDKQIKGKQIQRIKINLPSLVKFPLDKFKKIVVGSKIQKVSRRAKLLIIQLSNKYYLLIHLKMTGQIIFNGQLNKHTHLIYYFKDGSYLLHNDLRQFGFVKLVDEPKLKEYLANQNYGPEPLSKEFILKWFQQALKNRKRSKIKPLLMDQQFIAGIGNLYADEILFYAGVRPTRRVNSLTNLEIKKIYQQIKKVLKLGIEKNGSSAENYLDANGQEGNFVPLIKVYLRQGKPCYKCGAKIKKIKIGQRSAHYCPKCQK